MKSYLEAQYSWLSWSKILICKVKKNFQTLHEYIIFYTLICFTLFIIIYRPLVRVHNKTNIFSYFSTKTYAVGTQKNHLNETVHLSAQNICKNWWVRRYLQFYDEKNWLTKPVHIDVKF